MNSLEVDMLRCWKCRKYIANSDCLIKCNGKQLFEKSHYSDASQYTCNVWHMNLEALPDWVKCAIEKAEWMIGKLNCPFCGARLGGFNFVSNTKCSCGLFANIHLCKSRIDYQPACSFRLARSSVKHTSLCKVPSGSNNKIQHSVTGGILGPRNQGLSYNAKNTNGTGRLTEALCLEVRSTSFEMNNKKLHFKVFNKKKSPSASWPVNERCTVKTCHRKTHSLDLNIRERHVLLPSLYGVSSKGPIYHRQNETQPIYPRGSLQLESSRYNNSFQGLYNSDTDELPKKFSVTSCNTLTCRETECDCNFEASNQCSGDATADQLPFMMDLSSSVSAVEEDIGQQHITSVDLLQPANFSLVAVNQKLSKRERNKLKNLRKKQRKRERWLQKQTLNDNLNTDDEHEQRGDKESYLCAVCLDVYFNPYMCYPCHHIFCEPCLRMLAKDNPTNTPCPLCRTIIARVFFQTELNNSTKSSFPTEYLKLKESFQKSSSAKWPLPSCRKPFRVCEAGFQRHTDPVARRHFPHAAHRMDYMDFEDDSRGWWFDMDMVIIYIYSVNWVIGFIVFCFLCYFFFPF
ncbi:E3 ubiquitin-protein ligase RNF180 isoform X1 [Trachemys scripta elegans]|uniref:E3 ubiquitin-protein ligase RNF180 isoform X1 n=2 Tax=Trachemys scripta elegans TaxID=31138 RepID=UPI001555CA64|nr:E3 ubiquitin-protein ligase RNF180 isoform X1 [Trachemys scripta elegans]XP_034630024.1 E3 ubiquitin-protein ligase RNF180 isoform X1 [Trachemys scripta elegans]